MICLSYTIITLENIYKFFFLLKKKENIYKLSYDTTFLVDATVGRYNYHRISLIIILKLLMIT